MKARVIDDKGHLELVGDPAFSGLHPGDEVEVVPGERRARERRRVRGLWKGTHTSVETIEEVRHEMHAAMIDDGD